jgi:hypothetical protein
MGRPSAEGFIAIELMAIGSLAYFKRIVGSPKSIHVRRTS